MKTNTNNLPDMRYDFSFLSKGRLRAYNRMLEELNKESNDARELNEDELDLLAAAGSVENATGNQPTE